MVLEQVESSKGNGATTGIWRKWKIRKSPSNLQGEIICIGISSTKVSNPPRAASPAICSITGVEVGGETEISSLAQAGNDPVEMMQADELQRASRNTLSTGALGPRQVEGRLDGQREEEVPRAGRGSAQNITKSAPRNPARCPSHTQPGRRQYLFPRSSATESSTFDRRAFTKVMPTHHHQACTSPGKRDRSTRADKRSGHLPLGVSLDQRAFFALGPLVNPLP